MYLVPHTECTIVLRGRERYVFLWQREHVGELYRACSRFAVNPELSFSWFDAVDVIGKVRRYLQEAAK